MGDTGMSKLGLLVCILCQLLCSAYSHEFSKGEHRLRGTDEIQRGSKGWTFPHSASQGLPSADGGLPQPESAQPGSRQPDSLSSSHLAAWGGAEDKAASGVSAPATPDNSASPSHWAEGARRVLRDDGASSAVLVTMIIVVLVLVLVLGGILLCIYHGPLAGRWRYGESLPVTFVSSFIDGAQVKLIGEVEGLANSPPFVSKLLDYPGEAPPNLAVNVVEKLEFKRLRYTNWGVDATPLTQVENFVDFLVQDKKGDAAVIKLRPQQVVTSKLDEEGPLPKEHSYYHFVGEEESGRLLADADTALFKTAITVGTSVAIFGTTRRLQRPVAGCQWSITGPYSVEEGVYVRRLARSEYAYTAVGKPWQSAPGKAPAGSDVYDDL